MTPEHAMRRIRAFLRSDMRRLRWVLLGLYVTLIAGLFLSIHLDQWWGLEGLPLVIMLSVMLAGQAVLIFGTGTIDLCQPVRRRRLVLPVIVAAGMLTLLVGGFSLAVMELLYLDEADLPGIEILFWAFLLVCWGGWGLLIWSYVWRWERFQVISRLAALLFAGSLAELLAVVPSHLIVIRRPGCFVGLATMLGIIAGVYVMLFSFGPMIAVLFLRPRYRRERQTAPPFCRRCGYDLRASRGRCPECGTPFGEEARSQEREAGT